MGLQQLGIGFPGGFIDAIVQQPYTEHYGSTSALVVTPDGLAYKTQSYNNLVAPAAAAPVNAGSNRNVALTVRFSGTVAGTATPLVGFPQNCDYVFQVTSSGFLNVTFAGYDPGTPTSITGTRAVAPGVVHTASIVRVYGVQFQLWLDGVLDTVVADTGGRTAYTWGTGQLWPGVYTSSTTAGNISMVALHLDRIPPSIAQFHQNPWAIFWQKLPGLRMPSSGTQSFTYTPTGGVLFNGTAPQSRGVAKSASGVIALSGATTALRGVLNTPAGGIGFGGVAAVMKAAVRSTSGGLRLGGAASVALRYVGRQLVSWLARARRRGRR